MNPSSLIVPIHVAITFVREKLTSVVHSPDKLTLSFSTRYFTVIFHNFLQSLVFFSFSVMEFTANEGSSWQIRDNVTTAMTVSAYQPHSNMSLPNDSVNAGDPSHEEFYETAQFVTGLILYPIICVVGLTGNILTLIVLSHRKMLTSTNVFLSALAVADIIKLLNDCLYVIVNVLMRTVPVAGNRMMGYMYPFSHYIFNESVCVASWLTVSVAVERYVSVCHATRAKVVCTINRARFISTLVFVIMSVITIPSYLRYTRVSEFDPVFNRTMFSITLSALGENEQFMTGYTWVQNLLRCIIPLFVLLVLNACIIHALRKQRVPGKKMSARNRITLMLIVVIVVFIICIFPDAIMSTFFRFGYVDGTNQVRGIREITDTLLAINSAVNFIIYCVCSKGFRDVFAEIFCKNCVTLSPNKYQQVNARAASVCKTEADEPKEESSVKEEKKPGQPTKENGSLDLTVYPNGHQVSVYTGPQTYL